MREKGRVLAIWLVDSKRWLPLSGMLKKNEVGSATPSRNPTAYIYWPSEHNPRQKCPSGSSSQRAQRAEVSYSYMLYNSNKHL